MATLPTAWLAPPDNLSPSNHSIHIVPAPVAIGVTIAVIVGTAVTVLFFRKDKEVFLKDRILDAVEPKTETFIADDIVRDSSHPPMHNTRRVQRPPPSIHAKTMRRLPSFELQPKLDEMLGIKDQYPEPEHAVQTPYLPAPISYHSYFKPSHIEDRAHVDDRYDIDILQDDEKNSAYVPYPSSEASDDTYRYGKSGSRRANDLHVLDDESMFRRSPSFVSRSGLGDAY